MVFSNRNRKEDNILTLLIAFSLVNSNMLVLIFLSVFLILLLGNEFLFSVIRNIRIKKNLYLSILFYLPWVYGSPKLSMMLFHPFTSKGYINGVARMLRGLQSFFSMPFHRPVGGSIQSPAQLPQTIQLAVGSLRLFSFLCFVIISVISTFYTLYVFWQKRNQRSFEFSDSLLLFYLISLDLQCYFTLQHYHQ